MLFGTHLSVFVLLLNFKCSLQERNYKVVFSSFKCTPVGNGNYMQNLSCSCESSPPRLNFEMQMKKRLNSVRMSLSVYLERPQQESALLFKTTKLNLCELFHKDGINKSPILNAYVELLTAHGNMPRSCPVPEDFYFKFSNMTINTELFPYYIPEAAFKVVISLLDAKSAFIDSITRGRIIHKKRNTKTKPRKASKGLGFRAS